MKAKSKPEILKHGGNGGEKTEEKSEEIRGCEARSTVPHSLQEHDRAGFRVTTPLISSDSFLCFFLRSLRVSGFLVLTLPFWF